ncbi:hypothetical protein HQ545_00790 [Candidatus Woesearchaeota archaeon]|nr:hypothetical protein [Candidatus Woesearchaeota archaeon]
MTFEPRAKLTEILSDYEHPQSQLYPSTFNIMCQDKCQELIDILNNVPTPRKGAKRPQSPVFGRTGCRSLANYKKAMNEYLSRWGFKFNNPHIYSTPPAIFESVANYLEQHSEIKKS